MLASFVFIIALLTFIQHITGLNLYIDQLFMDEYVIDVATTAPGRMSLSTSVNFILVSLVICFLPEKRLHKAIQLAILVTIPVSVLVILKQIFGNSFLDAFPQLQFTALNTSICFILLFIGILNARPLDRQKFSFQFKIAGVFILTASVFLLVVFAIRENNKRFIDTANWVERSELVTLKSQEMLTYVQDVVTGTRGYIIGQNQGDLQIYYTAIAVIPSTFNELKALTNDNAGQRANLQKLDKLITVNITTRKQQIALMQGRRTEAAVALFNAGTGNKQLDELRSVIKDIQVQERHRLASHKKENQINIANSDRVIAFLQVLMILLMLNGFMVIYFNTYSRNKAELELRKSESLIRGIIDNTPNVISIRDLSGNYLKANKKLQSILKKEEKEIIGKSTFEVLPSSIAESIAKGDEEVKASKKLAVNEIILRQGPDTSYYLNSQFPLFDLNEKIYAICCVATDITPLKRAEEVLRESHQQSQQLLNGLESMMESSLDVICVIDENGRFLQVSSACEKLWGFTQSELRNKRYIDFIHEEDKEISRQVAEQIKDGRPVLNFENRYYRKNGTVVPVIWVAHWSKEERILYAIARDATNKRQSLEQLAKSEARLANAQKVAKLGNWDLNINTHEFYCSEEMHKIIGIPLNGKKLASKDLISVIHQEDKPLVNRALNNAITSNKSFNIEYRILTTDGSTKYLEAKGSRTLNGQENSEWLTGTVQDITNRKQSELLLQGLNQSLNKRATELQASNADLERFAYVASHDLQEPLRMVASFLKLLENKYSDALDDTGKKYISFAVDGAERMKKLIQDLLEFSRVSSKKGVAERVDCNELVKAVLGILQLSISESKATVDVKPLPVINCIKPQLQQLFQNLIGNALKYRNSSSCVIEVGCVDKDHCWEFYIRDNGIGIHPKFFEKIFIIFQRLHNISEYSGTGIGLAICKKIAEKHGGGIWLESELGKGSTFFFTISKNITDVGT